MSGKTEALRTFLIHFAQELGYEVQVDKLQNHFNTKGLASSCLQAHYDMVCMGRAPEIETYEKEGWSMLRRKLFGRQIMGMDNLPIG